MVDELLAEIAAKGWVVKRLNQRAAQGPWGGRTPDPAGWCVAISKYHADGRLWFWAQGFGLSPAEGLREALKEGEKMQVAAAALAQVIPVQVVGEDWF